MRGMDIVELEANWLFSFKNNNFCTSAALEAVSCCERLKPTVHIHSRFLSPAAFAFATELILGTAQRAIKTSVFRVAPANYKKSIS